MTNSNKRLTDEEVSQLWNSIQKFFRENYTLVDTSNHGVKCKITEYKPFPQPKMTLLNELFGQNER